MNLVNCFVQAVVSCIPYKTALYVKPKKFQITYTANCYGKLETYTDIISEEEVSLYVKGYEVFK